MSEQSDNTNKKNNNGNKKQQQNFHAALTPSQALNAGAKTFKPTPTNAKKSGNGGNGSNNNKVNGNNNDGEKPSSNGNNNQKKSRRRQRKKPNKGKGNNNTDPNGQQQQQQQQQPAQQEGGGKKKGGNQTRQQQPAQQNKKKQNNKRRKQQKKKYPWRKFIPKGTVDPITLENLISLPYPPFALVATAPYDPVPVWPVPENATNNNGETTIKAVKEDVEEINRRRLEEQWGEGLVAGDEKNKPENSDSVPPEKRHYHLYDGRALAYYLVSQLQFIDPLNRRDITRPELLNLDDYLVRHGFRDLNVTEAYDAKGITISTAGSAAGTAQGRAEILQQMASNLLNTLFGDSSVGAVNGGNRTSGNATAGNRGADNAQSALQQQYATMRQQEEEYNRRRQQQQQQQQQTQPFGAAQAGSSTFGTEPVYVSDDGGYMIIDDDENPGLRGGGSGGGGFGARRYGAGSSNGVSVSSSPFYSASHIASRYGNGVTTAADSFPSLAAAGLAATPAPAPAPKPANSAKAPPKPSKTLSRITGTVKKTNPQETHKQWLAREDARKRAALANLSFDADPSRLQNMIQSTSVDSAQASAAASVSGAKLERNRAFAEALGVKPATARVGPAKSGWARPADGSSDFKDELHHVVYPDSLLSEARERLGFVLKIEKKWRTFLKDDSSSSLSLQRMERPLRKFVHHYSDFWNLETKSYDPEPNRYIHCGKMLDTRMPTPLLSDALKGWRGPSQVSLENLPTGSASMVSNVNAVSLPPDKPEGIPLPTEGDEAEKTSRFDSLAPPARERPKLELAQRTLPLELPPMEQQQQETAAFFNEREAMRLRQERIDKRARKEREAKERKERALAEAFASDDEDDKSSGSEWEEPEVMYTGSDSEE